MSKVPRVAQRANGGLRNTYVRAVRQVSERLVRVTVGGDDLDDFVDNGTDQHVALLFFDKGIEVPEPYTYEAEAAMRDYARPMMRRYTIRRFDLWTREVDFDFVLHDAEGPASAWAARARVGDRLIWWGPTLAWSPESDVDAYLLATDETGLPAVDAILRQLPQSIPAHVVAEVADQADECYLADVTDRAAITWVHRAGASGGLVAAVRELRLPDGRFQVWVAGERGATKALRHWFLDELALPRELVHPTTYWIRGERQDQRIEERNRAEIAENRARDGGRVPR